MGYVLRVRLASFFTGAAVASAAGLYFLHKDYKIAHRGISEQNFVDEELKSIGYACMKDVGSCAILMNGMYDSLDGRLSSLEKLKDVEAPSRVEAAE